MRKSSRGNPWHDSLGRFCHGPTATVDTWGNEITDEQREESVCKSELNKDQYEVRSLVRQGVNIDEKLKQTEEEYRKTIREDNIAYTKKDRAWREVDDAELLMTKSKANLNNLENLKKSQKIHEELGHTADAENLKRIIAETELYDERYEDYEKKRKQAEKIEAEWEKIREKTNALESECKKLHKARAVLFLQSLPKKDISPEDALKGANPKLSVAGEDNCQCCVPAYELRRRGYDVKAIKGMNDELASKSNSAWINAHVIYTKATGKVDIKKQMKKWGDGARCQISINFKGKKYGHTFVAEQVNGETRFYDPQTHSQDNSDIFRRVESGATKFWRIDNLEPSDKIIDAVRYENV